MKRDGQKRPRKEICVYEKRQQKRPRKEIYVYEMKLAIET